MRTNNVAYYVWVEVQNNCEKPGDIILCGYYTCFARLLGCCNVTSLLFLVEAVIRTGATKPSSTMFQLVKIILMKTCIVFKFVDRKKSLRNGYATRHCIASETHAKTAVIKILKEDDHQLLKFFDAGTIDHDHQFLSASQDQTRSCPFCGERLMPP